MKNILLIILVLFFLGSSGQTTLDSARFYMQQSDFQRADESYSQWLEINKNSSLIDSVRLEFAEVKMLLNLKSEALSIFLEVEKNTLNSNFELYLRARISRADLYRSMADKGLIKSNDLFLAIQQEIEGTYIDPKIKARYFHRYAATLNEMGKLDQALQYSLASIKLSKEFHLKDYEATSFNEMAHVYEQQGYKDSALHYYGKACDLWHQTGNLRAFANGFFNRSRLYIHLGEKDSAILFFAKNLDIIKNKNWPGVKGPIYHHLSQLHEEKGDSFLAVQYKLLQSEEIIKEIGQNYKKNLLEINAKYLSEEKDKEIENQKLLLQNEERIIVLMGALLVLLALILIGLYFIVRYFRNISKKQKVLLKENEFLLGESNHRIKNNLQLVKSLIYGELKHIEQTDAQVIDMLLKKIESIGVLHKHLYLGESRELIAVDQYFFDIIDNFEFFLKSRNVIFKTQLEPLSLDSNKAMYLGLLITELIINSVKYAFDNVDNPEINIKLISSRELMYSDNGNGMKTEGTVPKLVKSMSKQLHGEYSIIDGSGFQFKLKF